MMIIGFLAFEYPSWSGGGGVGTLVQSLARALVERGHRVTVVALHSRGEPATRCDDGVRVFRFRQGCNHWYASKVPLIGHWIALSVRELERAWQGWLLLRQLHREEPFDVIEVTEEAGLCVAMFMRDVPVVARLHGEHYTFYKYTPDVPLTVGIRISRIPQRVALRRARILIAPSQAHAREIDTELRPDHPPIKVIPNAVKSPITDQRPQTADSRLLTSNDSIVLYVGRLERCKGVPILLEAAHRVLQHVPNVRFILAGGSHPTLTQEDLELLVHKYSLNGHVQILGHVPRQQLSAWYRRAALCVLPSYYETFGIAALEPMAWGIPVVATTAGGLPEVVADGVTGLLVPPGNGRALAKAIACLLKDPDLRERMGRAGRERAMSRFPLEHVVDQTLGVYQRAIGSRTLSSGQRRQGGRRSHEEFR